MRSFTLSVGAFALAISYVAAFPRVMLDADSSLVQDAVEAGKRQAAPPQGAGALPLTPPPFDAKAQLVSTTGKYQVKNFDLPSQ